MTTGETEVPLDFMAIMSALNGKVDNENFRRIGDLAKLPNDPDLKNFLVNFWVLLRDLKKLSDTGATTEAIAESFEPKKRELTRLFRLLDVKYNLLKQGGPYEFTRWAAILLTGISLFDKVDDMAQLKNDLDFINDEYLGGTLW